jgi:hypothetical protein
MMVQLELQDHLVPKERQEHKVYKAKRESWD